MKLKCFLICTLCSIFACSSSAEDETKKYTITTKKDTIIVTGDCTIPVEEFAPDGIEIYGNKEYGGQNNSKQKDLFKFNTKNLNPNLKGIEFKKTVLNNNGLATIEIKADSIGKKPIILHFHAAIQSQNNGYCPDTNNTFSIVIEKQCTPKVVQPHESPAPEGFQEQINRLENEILKLKELATHDYGRDKHFFFILLSIILVALLITYISQYRKQKKHTTAISTLEDKLNSLTKGHHNRPQQIQSHVVQSDANKMNDVRIKQFIIEQIQYGIAQYMNSHPKPLSQPSPLPNPSTGKTDNQGDHWTDTDNVKYNQSDNSFSIEDTTTHIFRLYKKSGSYYYTLVEDPDIREQLLGMLSAFEKCIAYQSSENTAKSMEPVRPGKLRKEGNKFYIDAKLEVRFI